MSLYPPPVASAHDLERSPKCNCDASSLNAQDVNRLTIPPRTITARTRIVNHEEAGLLARGIPQDLEPQLQV